MPSHSITSHHICKGPKSKPPQSDTPYEGKGGSNEASTWGLGKGGWLNKEGGSVLLGYRINGLVVRVGY